MRKSTCLRSGVCNKYSSLIQQIKSNKQTEGSQGDYSCMYCLIFKIFCMQNHYYMENMLRITNIQNILELFVRIKKLEM